VPLLIKIECEEICLVDIPFYLEKNAFVNAHFAYAEYLQGLVKKDKLKLKK